MKMQFWKTPLMRPFRRFFGDERGAILAETVIVLPVLFWAYLGGFVYFDAFSTRNTGVRATFTIADLISRQTMTMTPADFEGMNKIFDFVTAANRHNRTTHIRVTDVYYDFTKDRYRVNWSDATRGGTPLTDATINNYADKLPKLSLGDVEIVVETWESYTPAFNIGLSGQEFYNFVVTRPRMSPNIAYDASGTGTSS